MKVLAVSLALLSAPCLAHAAEWDHYQVILDRHPFGTLAVVNTNITPDFAKSLRLSSIWMAHGQPRAGFEDSSDKIKRDFVLGRGELSEDGVELLDVNVADEAAVIRKGTETATLHIQSGASTNLPVVGAMPGMPGMPPGGGNPNNPWREFYERYRQRHQQDGGGNATTPFPMPGGGATFPMSGGGAPGTLQVQPSAVILQNGASDAMPAGRNRSSGQMLDASGDGSTAAPTARRKHTRPAASE